MAKFSRMPAWTWVQHMHDLDKWVVMKPMRFSPQDLMWLIGHAEIEVKWYGDDTVMRGTVEEAFSNQEIRGEHGLVEAVIREGRKVVRILEIDRRVGCLNIWQWEGLSTELYQSFTVEALRMFGLVMYRGHAAEIFYYG